MGAKLINKPQQNHQLLISRIKAVIESSGISSNSDDVYHYKRLLSDKGHCHIELYGLTHFPIKLKTAYAESNKSNQAERYVTQVQRMRDEVFFIYDGDGWKKQTYKRALSDIKHFIGSCHVFTLREFEEWLKTKLVEKESR